MNESAINNWTGKSAEEILAQVLHQLRTPIHAVVGSLEVLKTVDQLSAEQTRQMIELGLTNALRAKDVIDAISLYMAERQNDS